MGGLGGGDRRAMGHHKASKGLAVAGNQKNVSVVYIQNVIKSVTPSQKELSSPPPVIMVSHTLCSVGDSLIDSGLQPPHAIADALASALSVKSPLRRFALNISPIHKHSAEGLRSPLTGDPGSMVWSRQQYWHTVARGSQSPLKTCDISAPAARERPVSIATILSF